MPQLSMYGALNTTALVVPDLYVQIVPPQVLALNGVPSNVIGYVGTASWGPVNQPQVIGNMAEQTGAFGVYTTRKFDLGTHVAIAVQQGASSFRCVRVTDGTDLPAEATLVAGGDAAGWTAAATAVNSGNSALRGPSRILVFSPTATGGILVARYTGTAGNLILLTTAAGTRAGTARITITMPNQATETFDNLAFATLPIFTTAILQGGTDGATPANGGTTGVTVATLTGADGFTRTGLYALRGQKCGVGVLCDGDDSTQWTTADAFGTAEGVYILHTGPSGDTVENAIAVKKAAGLDSPWSKMMFGDWIYWNDPVNATVRVVSPAAFMAGLFGNLSPEQSSLNKRLGAVVGSQRGGQPGTGQLGGYSTAEMEALFELGIDLICNPVPGGDYWAPRLGHNSSSDATRSGDNYTRMTNYLSATLIGAMGKYVGAVINDGLFRRIRSTLNNFLNALLGQGLLALNGDGSLPYLVVCDASNNPQSRTSLGYVQADVTVTYQGINEKFLVNLEGGATVVTQQSNGRTFSLAA